LHQNWRSLANRDGCQVRDSAIRRELVWDAIDRADGLSIIFRKCDHRHSGRNRIAIELDAARAGLVAVGAMLLRVSHVAGTWRVATMSDPAGNLFELIEE
jgi:Glyoxalase-like domain